MMIMPILWLKWKYMNPLQTMKGRSLVAESFPKDAKLPIHGRNVTKFVLSGDVGAIAKVEDSFTEEEVDRGLWEKERVRAFTDRGETEIERMHTKGKSAIKEQRAFAKQRGERRNRDERERSTETPLEIGRLSLAGCPPFTTCPSPYPATRVSFDYRRGSSAEKHNLVLVRAVVVPHRYTAQLKNLFAPVFD